MKMSIIQANNSSMNNRTPVDLIIIIIIELKVTRNNSKGRPQTAEV